MIDVRRLRVLREIAIRGSFSAAAQALHLTQPAVSRQIAALEREVGLRLLDRTSRGPRLTDAGRALVGRSEALLGQIAAAEAELDAIRGLEHGRLRLAAFPTAGATIVLDAVSRFRHEHPGVEISFRDSTSRASRRALRAGELDLALVFDGGDEEEGAWDGLERRVLLRDVLHVALPEGHPRASRPSVRLRDLADEPWIRGTQPGAGVIRGACVAAGFEPRIVAESDHALVIHGLVAAGVGVTLVPQLNARNVRPGVVLRPIAPNPPTREVIAAVLAATPRPPAVERMLEILAELASTFAESAPRV